MSDDSARVLRAEPIEIELADPIDPAKNRKVGLVFTANTLAEIEERWSECIGDRRDLVPVLDENGEQKLDADGEPEVKAVVIEADVKLYALEAWQFKLSATPYSTIRETLSIALGEPVQQVGATMLPSEMGRYAAAIGGALAIANGVDPTVVKKMMGDLVFDPTAAVRAELLPALKSVTPGATGSTDGPTADDPSTSSGG